MVREKTRTDVSEAESESRHCAKEPIGFERQSRASSESSIYNE